MSGALEGFRVVDASQVISGPLATRILADQGADVIKVEPLGGDLTRHLGGVHGISPIFATTNRSKRSVALDLTKAAGLDAMKKLVATADVFVQNFRPGAAERMGIGEPELRAVKPDLVYCSISGFGERGPFAGKRVYDPLIQGMSGLASIQGGVNGRPSLVRVIVPDKVTALTASQNITAALLARERTGKGQHLRLSMLDAVVAFVWPEGMAYHTFLSGPFANAKPPDRRDLVFETKDGHMIASTVAHREFEGFCRAAGKPDWLEDERFKDAAGLVKNAVARLELMAEVLKTRTTDDWLEALDAEDVPCAPVLSRDQLALHPQIQANELVVESDHALAGRIREARPAERMDGTPSEIRRPAPALGEHTDEVLRDLGLGDDALASLRAAGAIRDAS